MKNKHMCAGFTLAELLAVLIIVGILSSLSLGYYKRSVEQSRFAEGLSLSNTLVEAVNKAYFEDLTEGVSLADAAKRRKIAALDFSVPHSKSCTTSSVYCTKTPHFELQVETESGETVVKAYRGTPSEYSYYIQANPTFLETAPNQIACVALGAKKSGLSIQQQAQYFCESMGYTNCTSSVCTRPKNSNN